MIKPNNAKLVFAVMVIIGGVATADEHGHVHHHFAKDIDAFHAVLAPVWHARPGPERTLSNRAPLEPPNRGLMDPAKG